MEPEIIFKLALAPAPGMDETALLACIDWVGRGFQEGSIGSQMDLSMANTILCVAYERLVKAAAYSKEAMIYAGQATDGPYLLGVAFNVKAINEVLDAERLANEKHSGRAVDLLQRAVIDFQQGTAIDANTFGAIWHRFSFRPSIPREYHPARSLEVCQIARQKIVPNNSQSDTKIASYFCSGI
jgi:hypothetical protein